MALIPSQSAPSGRIGQALRALHGENVCGDQLGWWIRDGHWRLALADGLGHGREAHTAAAAAMRRLAERGEPGLREVFGDCDQALINTRGVALAVVDIRPAEATIDHASVGNIRTLLIQSGQVKRLGGARGIVGAGFRGLRPERLAIAPGDWLVLFSDGIRENAGLAESLMDAQPSDRLAERLLEQWAGDQDDASLLLYRHD
ncbi:SpoIIE family protein phosphatase [Thiocystis violacea]|uniref:SpoIIE family protein phosphatase n=1 Tax=Thiocystis violacea TaxID=13725 RepID=UPI001908F2D2|nr:SpoIIE family protein phosphatase [Thiocystis violacea]MBK1719113.1 serine/threonine protein phosphatase [Thiocystis violacea]